MFSWDSNNSRRDWEAMLAQSAAISCRQATVHEPRAWNRLNREILYPFRWKFPHLPSSRSQTHLLSQRKWKSSILATQLKLAPLIHRSQSLIPLSSHQSLKPQRLWMMRNLRMSLAHFSQHLVTLNHNLSLVFHRFRRSLSLHLCLHSQMQTERLNPYLMPLKNQIKQFRCLLLLRVVADLCLVNLKRQLKSHKKFQSQVHQRILSYRQNKHLNPIHSCNLNSL